MAITTSNANSKIAHILFDAIKQAKNEAAAKKVVKDFVAVLKRSGAVKRGPAVIALTEKLLEQEENIIRPIITSATALSKKQLDDLSKQLQKQYRSTAVHFDQKIDPSVLGGVSVKVNDMLYDATLKKKLLTLTNTLKQ